MTAAILSDLSPTEFLALQRLGFSPRGLVLGARVRDTGTSFLLDYASSTCERPELGGQMHDAFTSALAELRAEAARLGAEGVVGVRLQLDHSRWEGGQIVVRFIALGTAIAFDPAIAPEEIRHAPSLRLDSGPFTSHLSPHDFIDLLRAGYRPVSIATGNSVWQLDTSPFRQPNFGNIELADYTNAFAEAREEAMDYLDRWLFKHFPPGSPDAVVGVVGMSISEGPMGGMDSLIEFSALGTAVALASPRAPRVAPRPPAPRLSGSRG